MADFLTLIEHFGDYEEVRLCFIGDGNNVAHSLLLLGALVGAEVRFVGPEGYQPCPNVVARAKALHPKGEQGIWTGSDPKEALAGCNALYTDVWASMGQEDEAKERAKSFEPYQLNAEMAALAEPGAKIMHDLPAHRGEEITDEVMDGPNAIIFDQAENRLHAQKAIMVYLHQIATEN